MESDGGFDHSAVVRNENPLYPTGRRLATRSLYFTNVSPVLDARYVVGYEASDGGAVDVGVTVRLVVESVGEAEEGAAPPVYWRTERTLDRRRVSGVSPGENVTVPVSVDARRVDDRIGAIREGLNATPGTPRVRLVADVAMAGRANGRALDRRFSQQLRIDLGDGYYRVTGGAPNTTSRQTTTTVTVQRTYGPLRRVGAPLLALLGLLGLVGMEAARRRDRIALDDREREWLAYRGDRAEFDEWVHRVELPPEAEDLPRARASSLGDLVDLAIDADAAVLQAPDGETYRVVHDGYVYVYEAPELPDSRAAAADEPAGEADASGLAESLRRFGRPDSGADEGADAPEEADVLEGDDRPARDEPTDREQ
ncbi:MAG: DUF5305 domain-containing protein [Haloferacaceae archaeon]